MQGAAILEDAFRSTIEMVQQQYDATFKTLLEDAVGAISDTSPENIEKMMDRAARMGFTISMRAVPNTLWTLELHHRGVAVMGFSLKLSTVVQEGNISITVVTLPIKYVRTEGVLQGAKVSQSWGCTT